MSTLERAALSDTEHEEYQLRKEIEEYYLPRQLVDAIYELGEIPQMSSEAIVGVAFMDIADYTYLSKFLSPHENQIVLNGLYTAFNTVLERHGGYLNKIEGDSLMFHFGGLIDPVAKRLEQEEAKRYIAKELFFTCVEMQRVCALFNQANDKFLLESGSAESREILRKAFQIIDILRNDPMIRATFNAVFQVRIRIGANIGEVQIGNFGPAGAKQWDVVGNPVIEAKRMESTAPVGGLRISEAFYEVLEESGVADNYFQRFRREAEILSGVYKSIKKEELFQFSRVFLKDKKNAEFRSYSVQVNPALPESISEQVESLLDRGEDGIERILNLIRYYRGNRFVVQSVENLFTRVGIRLRKGDMLEFIYPNRFAEMRAEYGGDNSAFEAAVDKEMSLYDVFERLGRFQDIVKRPACPEDVGSGFFGYEHRMERQIEYARREYERTRSITQRRIYFDSVVFPLVFESIRSSILEFQHADDEGMLTEVVEDSPPTHSRGDSAGDPADRGCVDLA